MSEKQTNNITIEQDLERHKSWLNDLQIRIKELKKPPTAEEVCDVLSKYFNVKVCYTNNQFIMLDDNLKNNIIVTLFDGDKLLFNFYYGLPPHLITMIGRFFEGELNE